MTLIERPTVSAIAEQLNNQFSAKLLGGRRPVPGGNLDVTAKVVAGGIWQLWGARDSIVNESNAATMSCENLIPFAARRGVYLKPAAKALGYVRLTGTAGTTIPGGLEVVNDDSQVFQLDPNFTQPTVLGDAGTAVVRMRAFESGPEYNMGAGAVTLGSVVSGILADATVDGDGFVGGSAVETCEELRTRFLSLEAAGVLSTNIAWVAEKVTEFPGVTRAFASSCCDCCGGSGITIYPLMEGIYPPYGIPPASVLSQIDLWFFGTSPGAGLGQAPVGMYGKVSAGTSSKVNINIPTSVAVPTQTKIDLQNDIRDIFASRGGIGQTLCRSWFESVIGNYLGDSCYADVSYSAPDGNIAIDAQFLQPQCGVMPVLGSLGV